MTSNQLLAIANEQAKAWKSITTLASICEMTDKNTDSYRFAVDQLLRQIATEKKRLDRFIDRIPE